jgi:hypothetical protein
VGCNSEWSAVHIAAGNYYQAFSVRYRDALSDGQAVTAHFDEAGGVVDEAHRHGDEVAPPRSHPGIYGRPALPSGESGDGTARLGPVDGRFDCCPL